MANELQEKLDAILEDKNTNSFTRTLEGWGNMSRCKRCC